jgi:hypothetical protein
MLFCFCSLEWVVESSNYSTSLQKAVLRRLFFLTKNAHSIRLDNLTPPDPDSNIL